MSLKYHARVAVLAVAAVVAAPAALALDCNSKEVETIGQQTAALVRDAVSKAITIDGKEMLNLSACDSRGGKFTVEYKYNFMGGGGYSWVEGEATLDASGAGTVAFKKVSDKVKESAAAKGATLAMK